MSHLDVSILERWRGGAGDGYTGGQSSPPLSVGLARPPLLPSDQEAFVAAVRHHGPKTVVGPAHVASIDALRLGAPHRHAADIVRRRLPLSSHLTPQRGRGVEHEALLTFIAHFGVAGVFGLVDRV